MNCRNCTDFNIIENICDADLYEDHPPECLLKMFIQEFRLYRDEVYEDLEDDLDNLGDKEDTSFGI